jgi:hypothetical protein
MGLDFDKLIGGQKAKSRLVFDSLAFWLSQRPPEREELMGWFQSHAGNVGIVTGFNDLVVLDVDNPSYYDVLSSSLSKINTVFPVERTPHGFHIYLRCGGVRVCSSLYYHGRRIGHFSALGGFVTCSPSILADGSRYCWLPGRSLLDCEPVEIQDLRGLNLRPIHPFRQLYNLAKSSFLSPEK